LGYGFSLAFLLVWSVNYNPAPPHPFQPSVYSFGQSLKYAMTRKIHHHNYWTKTAVKGTGKRVFYFHSKVTSTGVVIIRLGAMFFNHKMVMDINEIQATVIVKFVA
jgi:hypothetical protein